jgi:hypothetical protein
MTTCIKKKKNESKKGLSMALVVGHLPEFKPQYCQKQKQNQK